MTKDELHSRANSWITWLLKENPSTWAVPQKRQEIVARLVAFLEDVADATSPNSTGTTTPRTDDTEG